jgi:hypothetical protein
MPSGTASEIQDRSGRAARESNNPFDLIDGCFEAGVWKHEREGRRPERVIQEPVRIHSFHKLLDGELSLQL